MDHSHHMPPTIPPSSGMDHMHMNHSGMDHSQHSGIDHMDHSSMDHSGHAAGSMDHSMMHMMSMSFHFGYDNEVVLFDFWKVNSLQGLLLSMFGIFIISALYEGLKYFREYLFWKSYNNLQYRSVQIPADKVSEQSNSSRAVHCVDHDILMRHPPTMFSVAHLGQTGLHIVQITVSYLLMLIFMTYNVWLCLAVVAGAATGYFLFGWKKSVVVDVTEHCH